MSENEPSNSPTAEAHGGTRWIWVLLGAVIMGGIALGSVYLALETELLFRIADPALRFWVFELLSGVGYLVGGFLVALLSPGRTTREPMYAAVLAFIAQTALLWYQDVVALTPRVFLAMMAIDGALAWAGAWIGERITRQVGEGTR
jgi:hypothetical protein